MQPQEQVLPTQPQRNIADQGPRPIPGEPQTPMSPKVRYPELYGDMDDSQDAMDRARFGVPKPVTELDAPRAVMLDEARRTAGTVEAQPAPAEGVPTPEEIARAIETEFDQLRSGKRSADSEQRITRLHDMVLRYRNQEQKNAELKPAEATKRELIHKAMEENVRLLQWMERVVLLTADKSVPLDQLFRYPTMAIDEAALAEQQVRAKDLPVFFTDTVAELDAIRISFQQEALRPVPEAAVVNAATKQLHTLATDIVSFTQSHQLDDVPVAPMIFGFARALKAMEHTLQATMSTNGYHGELDMTAHEQLMLSKKMTDFFASSAALLAQRVDEHAEQQALSASNDRQAPLAATA